MTGDINLDKALDALEQRLAQQEESLAELRESQKFLHEMLERVADLIDQLREAKLHYDQEAPPKRDATLAAVSSVEEFLGSITQVKNEKLGTPISRLRESLRNLDDGTVSHLFKAPKKPGNRPLTLTQAVLRAGAAASVDLLMKTGLKQKEAAKKIASCLRQHGIRISHAGPGRGTRIEADTVINWRKQLATGRGREEVLIGYRALIRDDEFNEDLQPETARRWVMKRLNAIATFSKDADHAAD